MKFPNENVAIVNNGINSKSHYFNGLHDSCKPIEFAATLEALFTMYKSEANYRNEENRHWLIGISEQLIYFEYTGRVKENFRLEGEENEPPCFDTYMSIYIDAYNVCIEIHTYFETLYPGEFSPWDDDTPEIISGIEYNDLPPQQTETKTEQKTPQTLKGCFASIDSYNKALQILRNTKPCIIDNDNNYKAGARNKSAISEWVRYIHSKPEYCFSLPAKKILVQLLNAEFMGLQMGSDGRTIDNTNSQYRKKISVVS